MKWHNIKDTPDPAKCRRVIDDMTVLLATDGVKVDIVFWCMEKMIFANPSPLGTLTHWMYPYEVFSPVDILKIFKIIDSNNKRI